MKSIIKKMLSLAIAVLCVLSFGTSMVVVAAEETEVTALMWPVPGHYEVTQGYIHIPGRFHNGIDILDGNISGATVIAAMGGTVDKVYDCTLHHETSATSCYGYGTCVMIYGDDGRSYVYAHLLGGSVPSYVYVGAKIAQGTKIGQVGNPGYSYAEHLHFVVAEGTDYLNGTFDPLTLTFGDHPDNAPAFTVAGIKYPIHKESGDYFEAGGTIFSPNNIVYGEAKVLDASGKEIFGVGISAEDKKNVFDLNAFADQMDFRSLADGAYRYAVCAVDEKGYSVRSYFSFTVGRGETAFATADTLYGVHDCDEELVDAAYKWDSGVITKEPTCSEAGVKTYTCKECGNTKTEDIPMVDHDFQDSFTVDSKPTADSAGQESRHCNNCSAVTDVTELPKLQTEEPKTPPEDTSGNGSLIIIVISVILLCAAVAFIVWRILAAKRGISKI